MKFYQTIKIKREYGLFIAANARYATENLLLKSTVLFLLIITGRDLQPRAGVTELTAQHATVARALLKTEHMTVYSSCLFTSCLFLLYKRLISKRFLTRNLDDKLLIHKQPRSQLSRLTSPPRQSVHSGRQTSCQPDQPISIDSDAVYFFPLS